MCGIFGLIRNTAASHPENASAAFVELGKLSVERGRDSAGFALVRNNISGKVSPSSFNTVNAGYLSIDNVTIIKDTCSFHQLWDDAVHLPLLANHRVAIGHTRWATQGNKDLKTNSSPLLVDSLVGTHNGDVSKYTIPNRYTLPNQIGSTDTEILYQALSRDRYDRRKMVDVLSKIEGRAALAWVDRYRDDRVYLARAALSPLAIAWDAENNFYWASNPRWFRDIDIMFDGAIGFHDILLIQEGTLITVGLTGEIADIEDSRSFTPTCRASDARLGDGIVWRGFDEGDKEADKAQTCHTVAKSYESFNYPSKTKAGRKTGGGYSGWDMSQPGFAPKKVDATNTNGSTFDDEILPFYNDSLSEIADSSYVEGIDGSVWEESEICGDPEEEAMAAACTWFDAGGDRAVMDVLNQMSMPSEIEEVMEEFELTSREAFDKFRDLLHKWTEDTTARDDSSDRRYVY